MCVNSKHKSFFRLAVPWVVSWLAEHAHLACAFVRRIFVSASLNSTLSLLDEPAQLPGCLATALGEMQGDDCTRACGPATRLSEKCSSPLATLASPAVLSLAGRGLPRSTIMALSCCPGQQLDVVPAGGQGPAVSKQQYCMPIYL